MWIASGWYLGYQSLLQYQFGRRALAKGVLDELGKDYIYKFAKDQGFLGQGIIGAAGNDIATDITKGPVRNMSEMAEQIAEKPNLAP